MAIKILTKNGVENTNIDGARDCNFNAGNRDGIVKSVLKEGNLFLSSSNVVALDTCELRIFGHRIVIDEIQYRTFSSIPDTPIRYALVGQIIMASTVPSFSLIVQYAEETLQKDNINNGDGTYEVEIGKFTLQPDGTVTDLVRTLDVITGGVSGGGSDFEVGTVTTNTLDPDLDAEVDVENRYDEEKGKTVTDFTFGIPAGSSTTVVQQKGQSTEDVMSQKATTDSLNLLEAKLNENIVKDPSKTYAVIKGSECYIENGSSLSSGSIDFGDGTIVNFPTPDFEFTHTYTDGVDMHIVSVSGVTQLPSVLFANHAGPIKVITGDNVTRIGGGICNDCANLEEFVIGKNVTDITSLQIIGSSGIKILISKAVTPPTCISSDITVPNLEKIIVPKSSINAYKSATGWSQYADKIVYEVDSSDLPDTSKFAKLDEKNTFKDIQSVIVPAYPYDGTDIEHDGPKVYRDRHSNYYTQYGLLSIYRHDLIEAIINLPDKNGTLALIEDIAVEVETSLMRA